jgi:hypothetical protein
MVALPPVGLLVAVAAGLVMAGYGFQRYYATAIADPYDATTTGTVLDSDLDPDASAQRGDYTPDVAYEYAVDGVTYEHDRVRANTNPLDRRGGTVLLGEYHEDAEVQVHYDPDDPQRAVLVPPEGGGSWLVLVAGGLLVTLAAAGIGVLGL